MNDDKCGYLKYLVEYLDGTLSPEDEEKVKNHLRSCPVCQNELGAVKRLYSALDADEVPIPGESYFRLARQRARQQAIPLRTAAISWLPKVLAPVFAVMLVIAAVKLWPRPAVEISIPVSSLIHDEDLNALLIERMVDDELMAQLSGLEENLAPALYETIDELNESEKTEFMDVLNKKYHDAIL